MSEIANLLDYLKKTDKDLWERVMLIASKYSKEKANRKCAFDSSIEVNILELESLINPDRFEFPDYEIGMIEVELEKDD